MGKITEERHAKIVNTLKTKTLKQTARIHHVSYKTVSRIRRGGETFVGYLLVLANDHIKKPDYITQAPTEIKNNPQKQKGFIRKFLEKLGSALWDESEGGV